MKKLIFVALFLATTAYAAVGKLQNADFATSAQITGAGGSVSQLLNSVKMYNSVDAEIMDTSIARWNSKLSSPVILTGQVSGILPLANGGTNAALVAANGAIPYSTASAFAFLAPGTSGQVLTSGGAGAPTWTTPLASPVSLTTQVSGILPLANGGTNNSAAASAGSVVFSNATQHAYTAVGTSGQVLTSAGAGTPTWTTPTTGTVTSVALSVPASSIFSVTGSPVTSSGTLGLVTTGTSGGIPYFSSTSQLSSSALLSQFQVVLGGGAGGAPNVVSGTGTTGQVLTSNGAGANPTWQASGAGGSGNVTSGATNGSRFESAVIGGTSANNNCTSTNCALFNNTGGFSSVVHDSTGNMHLTLTSTGCASAWNCHFSGYDQVNNQPINCQRNDGGTGGSPSTTNYTLRCLNASGTGNFDGAIDTQCTCAK